MGELKCKARVIGDQYICDHCGIQWDLHDEDRPKCKIEVKVLELEPIKKLIKTRNVGFSTNVYLSKKQRTKRSHDREIQKTRNILGMDDKDADESKV